MTKPRLLRSAGLISLGTLSSRILGLVREILMARFFGVSVAASGFFVAFLIPNLLRRFFGEGALSAAFIPTYVKTRDGEGQDAAWNLARNVGVLLFLVLSSLALVAGLAVTGWIHVGVENAKVATVLPLLRIMLPYLIGICLTALAMGFQNSHRNYALPAFTPCVLNLIWIASIYVLCPLFGDTIEERIEGVAWGVLAAGVLQFVIQLPALHRLGMRWWGPVDLRHPKVKRVVWLMGPAALGAAVTQVNVLLDKLLAYWVADYGPAALQYSERLIYLPLGLFATALGTVLLPELSGLAHQKDRERIGKTVNLGLRYVQMVMIPAAVGLIVLGTPLVVMMFQRGEFDATATLYTRRALLCYAPGLVVFSAAKVLVPVFYAHDDTRTPVRIGLIAVGLNIVLNLIFIFTLPEGWKHAGLALGTVLSECIQVTVLGILLTRRFADPDWRGVFRASLRFLLASIPMALAGFWIVRFTTSWPIVISVLLAVSVSIVVYGLACLLLRCPELREWRKH